MHRRTSFRLSERVMGMDEATWARHANPWSAWSRVTILPLLALAIWSRVWIGAWALLPVAAVLLWVWLNPRLFPVPRTTDAWMTQAVLGERDWLAQGDAPEVAHHWTMVRLLTGASGIGSVVLIVGLVWLNVALTLAGLVLAMGGKLWLMDVMVRARRDLQAAGRETVSI
ncbi:DUF6653 family protein [Sagittula sp. P11]|uniref:DUF6653 family protein n=1 Tax=Sagittula sp. P11 TaxID=2009329 RepID=UPI0020C79171|nr:DUF6653 family protein [Sagittula sp. P11]